MKNVFALSTSTVSGALVMLLFSVLLGDKAPWFIETLHASVEQVFSITLNVDNIFVDQSSASAIDPEQHYLDTSHNFYLRFPSDNWDVSVRDPGEFLKGLSVADIPFFHYTIVAMSLFLPSQELQKGDVTTTKISTKDSVHSVSFVEESKFDGIPLQGTVNLAISKQHNRSTVSSLYY